MTILHFNARSICNKFDELSSAVQLCKAFIVCITETWLNASGMPGLYAIGGYQAYHNYRDGKIGGGSSIYIHKTLSSQSLMHEMTPNNAYNICAVLVGNKAKQFLLLCIYRAPWATSTDDKELCAMMESVASRHMKLIVMGYFNLPCYHP